VKVILDSEHAQAGGGISARSGEEQINSMMNKNAGIDRSQLDIRVFLLPQNESTLAHYLAMHDDLYCHNIYNFFN